MTVEETRVITEMLKAIRSGIGGLSDRMINVELRQTAVERPLLGINTHLTARHVGVDGLAKRLRRVGTRLELVEE